MASAHGTPHPCICLWKKSGAGPSGAGTSGGGGDWKLHATLKMLQEEKGGAEQQSSTTMGRTVRSVAFAPTPQNVRTILAAASFDGSISIWEDFGDANANGINDDTDANDNVDASGPRGWECTAQLEGHDSEVKDVCWNSTGTLLASCGRDKSVWIWEFFLADTIGSEGTHWWWSQ